MQHLISNPILTFDSLEEKEALIKIFESHSYPHYDFFGEESEKIMVEIYHTFKYGEIEKLIRMVEELARARRH